MVPNGATACDGSIQYSQLIEINPLTEEMLCFQVTSSQDQSATNLSYLPQGWYTGYLSVASDGESSCFQFISR